MSITKGTPASSQIIFLEQRVAEQDAEIERLREALRDIADMIPYAMPDYSHQVWKTARAALEGEV